MDGEIHKPNKKETKVSGKFVNTIRDILAFIFWMYFLVKFIFLDIDIYLINLISPNFQWIVHYKFFLLLGIFLIIFLFIKKKSIITWTVYILAYPLIVILWKIPVFIFRKKSWDFAIAIIDAIFSVFQQTKIRFIITALFILSSFFIFVFPNKIVLAISSLILLIILFFVFIQRLLNILNPTGIYQLYNKIISWFGNLMKSNFPKNEINSTPLNEIELLDDSERILWVTNFQGYVFYNRICLYIAKKMKSYQKSGFLVFSTILGILLLTVFTIFSFSLIYYGVFKIDPNQYMITGSPTFFMFFYLSAQNLVSNSIPEIVFSSNISRILSLIQLFFSFSLVSFLISLFLSYKNKKTVEEIEIFINDISKESEDMEDFIKKNYSVSNIGEAIEILEKLESSIIQTVKSITESLN